MSYGLPAQVGEGGFQLRAEPAKPDPALGNTRTVYFNEDIEVGDRLQRALAYHRNRDYKEAFQQYLWVLSQDKDSLFRVDQNLVLDAREFCLRQIQALPHEFLASYRLGIDGEAKRDFEEAKRTVDVSKLEELSRQQFMSSLGDQILDLLGDLRRERGEPALAVAAWERLLSWCPDSQLNRATIRAKLVAAALDAGNVQTARRVVEDFARLHPGARLTVAGKEVDGMDYLRGLLPQQGGTIKDRVVSSPERWLEFGGDVTRRGVMPASFKHDVWVWSFDLPGAAASAKPEPGPGERVIMQQGNAQVLILANGQRIIRPGGAGAPDLNRPYLPTYSDGRFYLTDGLGVISLDARDGRLLWATPGYEQGKLRTASVAQYVRGGAGLVLPSWASHGVAIREGVIYATLRGETGGLLALDAQGGRTLWMLPRGDDQELSFLRTATELSDPLVMGDRIYIGVQTRDPAQNVERYELVCVDLNAHKLLWRKSICQSMNSRQVIGAAVGVKVLAAGYGLVFVNTDIGGLAAVDGMSGAIRWAYAYERQIRVQPVFVPQGQAQTGEWAAWNSGPVLAGSVLCVSPSDSELIYGLDALSGQTLWKVKRQGVSTILGASDDTLYLSGREVWWLDVKSGKVRRWANEELKFAGQGFVTADSLYVPTPQAIYRFDRAGCKLMQKIGLTDETEAGNLLLVDGKFVSVTDSHINVFDQWERAYAQLQSEMKSSPDDPSSYQRLGQCWARRQEWPPAIENYRAALVRLQKRNRPGDTEAAAGLAQILYGVYERALAAERQAGRPEAALAMAQARTQLAWDKKTGVESLLTLVECQKALSHWMGAVDGLQTMLERHPDVLYAFEGQGEISADVYAATEIKKLIKEHGQQVYGTYDQLARKLLGAGGRDDLTLVIQRYGNSVHAGSARVAFSRMLASSGDFREAGYQLSRFLESGQASEDRDRATAMWLMAGYFERGGLLETARRYYVELAKAYPEAVVQVDGRDRRVFELVKAKLESGALAKLAQDRDWAPVVGGLMTQRWTYPLKMGFMLDVPGDMNSPPEKVLFASQTGDVLCVEPVSGRLLWQKKPGNNLRLEQAAQGRMVFTVNNNQVQMLDLATGDPVWRYNSRQTVEQLCFDGTEVAVVTRNAESRNTLVLLLGATDGAVKWQREVPLRAVRWVGFQEGRVVLLSTGPARAAVFGRDDGKPVADLAPQGLPANTNLVGWILPLDSGRMIMMVMSPPVGGRPAYRMLCMEMEQGKVLWTTEMQPLASDYNTNVFSPDGSRLCAAGSPTTAVCVDVESGRKVWQKDVSEGRGNVAAVNVGQNACWVLRLGTENKMQHTWLLKLALEDGRLLWSCDLPPGIGRSIMVGRDAVVVPVINPQAGGQPGRNIRTDLCVVDAGSGKVVQVLATEASAAQYIGRITGVAAVDGRLWFAYPDAVVGFGPVELVPEKKTD